MPRFNTLDNMNVSGKRVLVRCDLNVPMKDGKVTDATRIARSGVTLKELTRKGARVIVLSHFGRPKGTPMAEFSLQPLVEPLGHALGQKVSFAPDCLGKPAADIAAALKEGEIALLENLRFHNGEETNDPIFAQELAKLGELYVNDAFSCAHRAHASTEGLAHLLPAAAGRLMQEELDHLNAALEKPARPVIAIVGGAKVSTKLELLGNLVTKVDRLVIGGGMANTFLFAQGIDIGKSLAERDLADTARQILNKAQNVGCTIVLPTDAVVASEFKARAPHQIVDVKAVPSDQMILDVGPQSIADINQHIDASQTLVWNGPLGAFELTPFDMGTVAVARHAAQRSKARQLLSVAGGGDTVAALSHAGVEGDFTYISTAGGAFLEWLEGKELPGVTALKI